MSNSNHYTGNSSAGRKNTPGAQRSKAGVRGQTVQKERRASRGQTAARRRTQGESKPAGSRGKTSRMKKKKKHPRLRLAGKIFLLLFLLAILTAMTVFYFKYGNTLLKWQAESKRIVKESTVDDFKSSEASYIYDSKGKAIAKLKGEKETYYLESDQIPQYVKDAFIQTEDRDFYEHKGYDPKALLSAAIQLIKSKMRGEDASRGASTITQQLARNTFTDYLDYTDKSYSRKIREIFVAMELEKKYKKEQILEFYINNVFFANGYYGIEAASRGYFSKTTSDLSLAEIAFVCSIPNRPSSYDPFEHFDNTIKRKGRILDQMLKEECISASEYSDAYYADVVLNPAEDIKPQDYLATYAISCATKALMEKENFKFRYEFSSDADRSSYDKEYGEAYDKCYKSLYNSGYHIYTSLNKKIQKKLQKAVNGQLASFTEKRKGVYTLQGAATCINNKTGRVVAIVGGRKQKSKTGYTLNRAYLSFRQPGSSFKPLAVYTPQLERGYTPDSIVDDTFFEGGPRNSNGKYSGKIPLRYAVEQSKNVIAWKLFEELTPRVGLSYVQKMQFSKIVDNDFFPASSLGGLTNGVSTVEMASAYAALANHGRFRSPTCITKITDDEGKVILNMNRKIREKQVYEVSAADTMTDILTGVLIRGTGRGKGLSNMACAGKTGTTSDKKDGWFCGYTPYYSTAVWVGYDTPRELSTLYGNTYPLYIWNQFMEELHSGLEYAPFVAEETDDKNGKDMIDASSTPMPSIDPDMIEEEHETTVDTPKPVATKSGKEPTPKPEQPTTPPEEAPVEGPAEGGDGYEDVGNETTAEDVGQADVGNEETQ